MQQIEVVHIFADKTVFRSQLSWQPGIRVCDALELSGVFNLHPDLRVNPVGVYGKIAAQQDQLEPGSRIEIYRCLRVDPKEQRRQRAKKEKN